MELFWLIWMQHETPFHHFDCRWSARNNTFPWINLTVTLCSLSKPKLCASVVQIRMGGDLKAARPQWSVLTSASLHLGGVWGCHCRARWYTQPGWGVEAQLHHLYRVQILVLPHSVCCLWHPGGSALGLPVRLHLVLSHLGCGSLHQELPDWVAVRQPHLLPLHSDLLRSLLWSSGEDFQQCACGTAQGGLGTPHSTMLKCDQMRCGVFFIQPKISPGIFAFLTDSSSSHCNAPCPHPPDSEIWQAHCAFCHQRRSGSCSRRYTVMALALLGLPPRGRRQQTVIMRKNSTFTCFTIKAACSQETTTFPQFVDDVYALHVKSLFWSFVFFFQVLFNFTLLPTMLKSMKDWKGPGNCFFVLNCDVSLCSLFSF